MSSESLLARPDGQHLDDSIPAPVHGGAGGVMGATEVATRSACSAWQCQFDALVRKNLQQVQSRIASLLVIVLAPAGGGLLVELVRGQVEKYGSGGNFAAAQSGALIISVGITLTTLVYYQQLCGEKQRGLTGAMRLAGLSESAYWAAYAVLYTVMSALGGIIFELLVMPTRVPMFVDTHTGVIAFVIFLYLMGMTSLASFWSSFSQRPIVVNLLSFFLFSVVGVSSLVYGQSLQQLDVWLSPPSSIVPMLFVGLMPWMSFARVWLIIGRKTSPVGSTGSTFEWGSLVEGDLYCPTGNPTADPDCIGTLPDITDVWRAPSAGFSLGIIVAAIPVYFLLAWYTSQAFGGEMRQSFVFPFLPTYWGCARQQNTAAMGDTVAKEQILSRREKSIRCAKLSKAYDQVTALKELSLKMEPNAITCLLGHNGAGKSTLIHTLTGLVNATFGDAFVMGMSVRDQMADIQKVMGICPQHDKLWEELTAEQHLFFYARFKGMQRSELREYVAAALRQFGLEEEGNETVGTFSGGMKRRVSVAVSAMANPSVVYLDEPTTGMDPLHRRQVWDMVQQLRTDRIVVLTTHSMEEADSLGDQIAIMASGKLRALGSSIFLKQKFGRGFQVGLISRPEDSPEVERLIEELLPGAETVSAAAGNIAISLGKRLLSRVPDFFRALEDGELSKYVNEWSLSNTRLEEVFLRLCAGNTEVNAGGTGDSGTLTFDDLSSLTASEAVDVVNELAWTAELINSSTDGAVRDMTQMAVPSFSTDDGYRILAGLATGEVVLGNVAIDERTKIARDKTIGTIAKPLIAKPVDDGKGTLSVVLPATGLPAAKLCVQVPDLRKIFIEVPMDGTVGEEIFFTAPPPLAQSTSTNLAGGVQMEGDELFRSLRDPARISMAKQTWALVAKQASLQARQKKSNCCQCYIFFTLVLVGLLTLAPLSVTPTAKRALLSSPALEYRPVSGLPATQGDVWITDLIETTAPELSDTVLHNFTETIDGHRRLQALDPELSLVSPVMFMFCMATMLHMPKFVYQLIEEKQQRLYHSMRLQGLSLVAYWLGVYIYDFLLYGSFATVFIGLGYIFKMERFMHANAIRFILAAAVFGHSQIGMAVFASSIVRSPKLATVLFYLIIVSSCIATIVVNTFIPVNWSPFLLMVPTLAYPRSIALILAQGGGFAIGAGSELGRALWIQALIGTALFFVGILLHIILPNEFGMTESHLVTQLCSRLNKTDGPVSLTGDAASTERANRDDSIQQDDNGNRGFTVGLESSIDLNVAAEESRVRHGDVDPESSPILIDELRLVYLPGLWTQFVGALKRLMCSQNPRAPKQAVGGVCLSIGKGELFGLLGPNGAGKTLVVNILSGLIVQSEGQCHVGSFNTSTDMASVHTILGVCPQFDTVWSELTVEEHLILYARLKGVSSADQRGLVQSVAESIQLDGDPLRQPASQLSGGMLRRLSLGIALIADPQVVLLDEPTTGLDPETRRMVWDIIEKERTKGRCIVLTTHSMEEADTLCTRIGIMAQGKMRSLGSSSELKTRHGQGYRLSFTLKSEGSEVDEALLRNELCPTATLIYSFSKSRVYLLPTEDTNLGALFDKLVNMKESLGVREWGLSQATLEEAFIRICEEAGTT